MFSDWNQSAGGRHILNTFSSFSEILPEISLLSYLIRLAFQWLSNKKTAWMQKKKWAEIIYKRKRVRLQHTMTNQLEHFN